MDKDIQAKVDAQVDEILEDFKANYLFYKEQIFSSLINSPEKYLAQYLNALSTSINMKKGEAKQAVQVNTYIGFFEEMAQVRKDIEGGKASLCEDEQGAFLAYKEEEE